MKNKQGTNEGPPLAFCSTRKGQLLGSPSQKHVCTNSGVALQVEIAFFLLLRDFFIVQPHRVSPIWKLIPKPHFNFPPFPSQPELFSNDTQCEVLESLWISLWLLTTHGPSLKLQEICGLAITSRC